MTDAELLLSRHKANGLDSDLCVCIPMDKFNQFLDEALRSRADSAEHLMSEVG